MLILALDTTTPRGSIALARGPALLGVRVGDPAITHGERLPADIATLVGAHGASVADIERYAVAAGPGSFTGLRVGIATIQALALVHGRSVVAVSALAALAATPAVRAIEADLVAVWMDAHRHEVFGALYRPAGPAAAASPGGAVESGTVLAASGLEIVEPHIIGQPTAVLDAWRARLRGRRVVVTGDGAVRYADVLRRGLGASVPVLEPCAALAPTIALVAERLGAGAAMAPHRIRLIYLRRPDAELARARQAGHRRPDV